MRGYAQLPEADKAALEEIADQRFVHTQYSYNEIVASTVARALEVIRLAGGKVTDTDVAIPHQMPEPPELALSNFGVPVKRVSVDSVVGSGKESGPPNQVKSGVIRSLTRRLHNQATKPSWSSTGPVSPYPENSARQADAPTSTSTA